MSARFNILLFFFFVFLPVLLVCAHIVWPHIPNPGHAAELSLSQSILKDQNKIRDVGILPAILSVFAVFFIAVLYLKDRWEKTAQTIPPINLDVTWRLIAGGFAVVLVCAGILDFWLSLVFAVCALLFTWRSDRQWINNLQNAFIISSALSLNVFQYAGWSFGLVFPVTFLLVSGLLALGPKWVRGRVQHFLVFLSTAYFSYILVQTAPFFWRGDAAEVGLTLVDWVFFAWAALIIGIGIFRAVKTLSQSGGVTKPSAFIVSFAVLAVSFQYIIVNLPITPDDYHFGEQLHGYVGLFDGRLFQDLIPAHGLVDSLDGAVAILMGEPSAAGVQSGHALIMLLSRFVLIYALFLCVPSRFVALIAGFLFTPVLASALPTIALFLLGLNLRATKLHFVFGALLSVLCALLIFMNLSSGIALAIGLFGMALTYVVINNTFRETALFICGSLVSGLLVIFVFLDPVLNWLNYMYVSASTNLTIYGNTPSSESPFWVDRNFAFLFVLPALVLPITLLSEEPKTSKSKLVPLVLTVPLFLAALLVNGYAFGRVDGVANPARSVAALDIMCAVLIGWLFFFKGRAISAPMMLVVVLFATLPSRFDPHPNLVREVQRTMPPPDADKAFQKSGPIADMFGPAPVRATHLDSISNLDKLIDQFVPEGQSIINVTNRSAIDYYLQRPLLGAYTSSYNAAPMSFQREMLEAWDEADIEFGLVVAQNAEHDGISLSLRSHFLYRYILDNFEPIIRGDYIFVVRGDAAQKAAQLRDSKSEQFFQLPDFSDVNWKNGVAIDRNAEFWSFFVERHIASLLNIGDVLVFSDGFERRVERISGLNVALTGPDLPVTDEPLSFEFKDSSEELKDMDLWATAFPVSHFRQLPSAWGRSENRLSEHLNTGDEVSFDVQSFKHLAHDKQHDYYSKIGPDPFLSLRPTSPIDPSHSGILRLELKCSKQGPRHDKPLEMQVFWKSAEDDYNERHSVRFTSTFGVNLIPLDSRPEWYQVGSIEELRIDVNGGFEHCDAITFGPGATLLSRKHPNDIDLNPVEKIRAALGR